jgi:hypothetical protein
MRKYNFLNENKVWETGYHYSDFDLIVKNAGYFIEKNGFLHLFFDWSFLDHWSFNYELYSENQLKALFRKSQPYESNVKFLVRLSQGENLVEISSQNLAEMVDDLIHETGMGWEAISEDGNYIMEFTDDYQHKAISNFEILPNSKVK